MNLQEAIQAITREIASLESLLGSRRLNGQLTARWKRKLRVLRRDRAALAKRKPLGGA